MFHNREEYFHARRQYVDDYCSLEEVLPETVKELGVVLGSMISEEQAVVCR